MGNLSDARFTVSTSNSMLLSDLDFGNSNLPLTEEFLIKVTTRKKLMIVFVPDKREKSFAFINAMEVFLAPPDFVRDSPPHVTRQESKRSYNGVLDFRCALFIGSTSEGGMLCRRRIR